MLPFALTILRFIKAISRSWADETFRAGLTVAVLILLSGTTFYRTVEGWSWIDSLYFSVTTMSTVGLGDLSPVTPLGKVFTVFYIFVGVGVFVALFAQFARAPRARPENGPSARPKGHATMTRLQRLLRAVPRPGAAEGRRRRRVPFLRACLAILCLTLASFAAGPTNAIDTPSVATWGSLAPSVEPYDDPFVDMPFEQIGDLRTVLQAEQARADGRFDSALEHAAAEATTRLEDTGLDVDYLLAQREVVMTRRKEAALGVTATHVGKDILIDGYALPLRAEAGRVVEFLLVPWVGACIHTPPPPPNQIVHVDYPEGFEAESMFTAIRLQGQLAHRPAEHDLFLIDGRRRIPAAYALNGAVIGGAPGDVVAAASADAGLGWFVALQARITDIFTTAMTDMERGRSAGAVALAVLIAFAYGVLHTLGPGHGKAVVVSYFVGHGGGMRRGLVMGARIAMTHVLSAVIVVFAFDLAVRQATGAAPADYRLIRLGSYAAILAIGSVMLWRAVAAFRATKNSGVAGHTHDYRGHAHAGCAACAAVDHKAEGGGWIATAVGAVPCTGALLVMLFGIANDLVAPAVLMVVAISAGMALAMSAIGVVAIIGRNWAAARFAVDPERRFRFEAGARIVGAGCVVLIGGTLFVANAIPTGVPAPGVQSLDRNSVSRTSDRTAFTYPVGVGSQ